MTAQDESVAGPPPVVAGAVDGAENGAEEGPTPCSTERHPSTPSGRRRRRGRRRHRAGPRGQGPGRAPRTVASSTRGALVPVEAAHHAGAPFYLGVLFGLNMVDELDRTAFGVLLPEIRDHFGLDNNGILTVVSLSLIAGLLLALPIGFYGDRWRRVPIAAQGGDLGRLLGPDRRGPEPVDARRLPGRRRAGPGRERPHPQLAARRLLRHPVRRGCTRSTATPTRSASSSARSRAG